VDDTAAITLGSRDALVNGFVNVGSYLESYGRDSTVLVNVRDMG
jgi:hypothetical protein